ncbi:mechanosensitive ion channel family protein [Prevotella sp. S7 MS 2]|uniref:mechanosensitive ion channel family protein n=1 Tax=Prevotella sp. S7 MS 2 TaxID=1287488 RepID=UPI0005133484|nr:mechanosensitive ion channel family protein [Prevotella sp. S7 MS 2]KGI60707.1 mechanosensitive ion channel protein [Prevotella sp. S7 MS 2]
MYKKIVLTLAVFMCFGLNGHAVLKEKDLANTLSILRTELTNYHSELEKRAGLQKEQQQQVRDNIMTAWGKSNQNALMLYSQKPEYVFDLTYACHEATKQYRTFKESVMPFRLFLKKTNQEISRYDSLITSLSSMYTVNLSERSKIDRNVCLTLAVNIRHTLKDNSEQFTEYIKYYKMTEEHLRNLDHYANKRYSDIQNSIFSNSGTNYLEVLSRLKKNWIETKETVETKYFVKSKTISQWAPKFMIGLFISILFYGAIALALNILVIRFLIPKRLCTPSFLEKRNCVMLSTSVISLAIILGVVRFTVDQNFIYMASGLMVEYMWLLGVILISLLLRLDGNQIKSGFQIYSPIMLISFIVIAFRITLMPNDVVNLSLPLIQLLCTLWQWYVIRKHNNNIPKSDVFYTYCSLLVFSLSVISSWIGYVLFSVQILIWWMMQLTCVLTITCLSGWLREYSRRKGIMQQPITKTWFFRLVYSVLLPTLGVLSVMIAIYWAADVFNLSDTTKRILTQDFIHTTNFMASISTVALVIILYFLFAYINHTSQGFLYHHFEQSDPSTAASRMVMAKNVIQVVVWGTWLLISLSIFHVSNTWLVVITGGLSTGVGFASKDILENIYYGISLMAGRIKVGDYIECDGIRGKVSSISYTSTMIEATDGSVIAFQNSQLLTKNYKNITKNHGYELDVLEVGVAYGTNIAEAKNILINAIQKLGITDPARPVKIVLTQFDDSCITLKILVWVNVLTHFGDDGIIMECIYETLNAHGIEIPFPQREVRILNTSNKEEAEAISLKQE